MVLDPRRPIESHIICFVSMVLDPRRPVEPHIICFVSMVLDPQRPIESHIICFVLMVLDSRRPVRARYLSLGKAGRRTATPLGSPHEQGLKVSRPVGAECRDRGNAPRQHTGVNRGLVCVGETIRIYIGVLRPMCCARCYTDVLCPMLCPMCCVRCYTDVLCPMLCPMCCTRCVAPDLRLCVEGRCPYFDILPLQGANVIKPSRGGTRVSFTPFTIPLRLRYLALTGRRGFKTSE